VKPGHKEVKDKWWALYYRKLLPQYHLRDNYLGRKINQWIEEDLEPLKVAHPEQFVQKAQGRPGRKPKLRFNPDGTPMKRRKPNSSKEGTMPAYANVEMIQPANKGMEAPPFMRKLAECCVDGSVNWSAEELDADMAWFKKNRIQIMENIPSLTKGTKRKKEPGGSGQKRQRATDASKPVNNPPEGIELNCDTPWIKTDMHKTAHAYVIQIDMPGVAPETDLVVQTDGNKLVLKGERKNRQPLLSSEDEDTLENLVVQRPEGPFSLEVVLPSDADVAHTEQTYSHGVLTIKVPLREPQWRTLNILHLSPEHSPTTTTL
jgi:HSP20 family molecular chaperone IbpA